MFISRSKLSRGAAVAAGALALLLPATAAAETTVSFADDAPRAVVKDQVYTGNVVVSNTGTTFATNAYIRVSVWGSANEFSPTHGSNPKFNPSLGYASGCVSVDGAYCMLGTIAPGESKVVGVSVGGVTHFGRLMFNYWGGHDTGDISGAAGYNSWTVQVTNGASVVLQNDAETPQSAPGRTDILIPGQVVVGKGAALDQGLLFVRTTRLSTTGNYFQSWNATAEPEVGSIRSLKLANGTLCAPRKDPISGAASLNDFVCPLHGLAAGTRMGYELIVNWPTSRRDMRVDVSSSIVTPAFMATGSSPNYIKQVVLNPNRTVDLVTVATSQAVMGRDRDANVRVKVTNNGTSKAENVWINGDARGGIGGTFNSATLGSECTSVAKPMYARCFIGDIAPGATTTLSIDVHSANDLGTFVVSFGASHSNWTAVETNPDNNAISVAFTVVKPNVVPFLGVKQFKAPMRSTVALAKRGTTATVKCPSSCKVKTQLRVRRPIAERLGLSRPIPRNSPGFKKALPYIIIGQGAKARTGEGKVVVRVTLSRKYRAKVLRLRAPMTTIRSITTTSTDPSTRGATNSSSRPWTVRPPRSAR